MIDARWFGDAPADLGYARVAVKPFISEADRDIRNGLEPYLGLRRPNVIPAKAGIHLASPKRQDGTDGHLESGITRAGAPKDEAASYFGRQP